MIPKIIQIVSFLLYHATPNHFMPLHLSSSRSHFITITASTTSYFSSIMMFAEMAMTASANTVEWSKRHVDTKLGLVQGFVVYPNEFDGVEVFLNLPFASPPVGNLRFMPPVSGESWSGVRKSDKPSPVCPQVLPKIDNETETLKSMPRGRLIQLKRLLPHLRNQSEDCLYLNLYVPLSVAEGQTQDKKLAVLLFIHGESFAYGSGNPYDPSMLVSIGNIIVLTLNYRVGILGFLNANSDSHFRLPYNFALLDIIAGLQWIQENIALFGGDKGNVTLFGHGKGAVLVNFLMISSAVPTGLLFHRVILSSGSALSPLTSDLSKGSELSKKFAKKLGCPHESESRVMLECLRDVPLRKYLDNERLDINILGNYIGVKTERIVFTSVQRLDINILGNYIGVKTERIVFTSVQLWSLFGPSGDGIVVKNEFPPDNVIMNKLSSYPLLFGVTKSEMLPSLSDHDAVHGFETEKRREFLKNFIDKYYRFHRNEILAGAIHEYTNWESPFQHPLNVRDETLDALADAQVVAPLTKVGDLHSQSSRSRAYFYVLEHQSKSSDYQQRLGGVHGEDLVYILGIPIYFYENDSTQTMMIRGGTSDISSGVEDSSGNNRIKQNKGQRPKELGFFTGNYTWNEVQLSLTIIRMWTNFIRTGNPNGDPKSQVKGEQFFHPLGKVEEVEAGVRNEAGTGGSHYTSSNSKRPGTHTNTNSGTTTGGRSSPSDSNRFGRENLQKKQQEQLPDPIFVEWPQYEPLDKRYIILDLRPRIKSHYRAHKLAFFLHLVPDYQKNDEGTSITSIHHGIIHNNNNSNNNTHSISNPSPKTVENLSKVSVIPNPTAFASGSGIVSQPHNSSVSSNSPKLGMPKGTQSIATGGIDPDLKEQQDFSGESTNNDGEESVLGFQYSTALSVIFAIGSALLILNLLIIAIFLLEKEKRLNAMRKANANSQPQGVNSGGQSYPSPRVQTPLTSTSLKRRKENGGISSFYTSETTPRDTRYGEVSYGNYSSIKRYSEIPGGSCSLVRSGSSKSTHRRNNQEHAMSIDMSENLTNDPNFSPQLSAHGGTLEIGTTFVGIEQFALSTDPENYHQLQDHHQCNHFLHQQDNSSIDDGQSSQYGSVQ